MDNKSQDQIVSKDHESDDQNDHESKDKHSDHPKDETHLVCE